MSFEIFIFFKDMIMLLSEVRKMLEIYFDI